MAKNQDEVINVVKKYLDLIKANGIDVNKAYLFGSYSSGKAHKDSDIDIAIISENFTDKLEDMTRLKLLTEDIDLDICPHTYSLNDFENASTGSFLVEEIINKGILIEH